MKQLCLFIVPNILGNVIQIHLIFLKKVKHLFSLKNRCFLSSSFTKLLKGMKLLMSNIGSSKKCAAERVSILEQLSLDRLIQMASKESGSNSYYGKIEKLADELRGLNLLAEIERREHVFYPKKAFLEHETLEMFFITKENITVTSIDGRGIISLRSIPLSIKQLDFRINTSEKTAELFVHDINGEVFSFSSIRDTSSEWKPVFYDGILHIYRFLS
jgi:hypothetical protein